MLAACLRASTTYLGTTTSGPLVFDGNNGPTGAENIDTSNGWTNLEAGVAFTVPFDFELQSLSVGLGADENAPVTMTLYRGYNGGTLPYFTVATSELVLTPDGPQLDTFLFNDPILEPGQSYFLVASVPISSVQSYRVTWYADDSGNSINVVEKSTPGVWNNYLFPDEVAYQLAGAAVPEPSTFALLGAGLLAFGMSRNRRERSAPHFSAASNAGRSARESI